MATDTLYLVCFVQYVLNWEWVGVPAPTHIYTYLIEHKSWCHIQTTVWCKQIHYYQRRGSFTIIFL